MSVAVEKLEKNMAKLTIEVSAEELEKAIQGAYQKQKNRINIPGFRKGKAPRKMIEKMYGVGVFYEDAANALIPEAYSKALDECEETIVSQPSIDVVQLESGKPFIFTAEVALKPEVTLGEYKGLEVPKADLEVTEEEIAGELRKEQEENSRVLDVDDRAVADGDKVTLDFEGFVDGEAFDGGKGTDYPLTIGSGSFIPGFEEQLVGANIGEEKEVNVTFPEEYHSKDLAGKAAMFKCTIKSIKRKELPEINDELAKKVSKFDTLDELKADIRKNLEENAERKAENDQKSAAIEQATNNIQVDIPAVMIDNRVTAMIQEMAMRLEQQGMKLEQYLQYAGTDIAKIREDYRETAEKNVKTDLMLEEVAKAEDIKVEAKDLDAEVAAMAAAYGATPQQVQKIIKEQGRIGDLAASVLRKKTAQFIIDNIAE